VSDNFERGPDRQWDRWDKRNEMEKLEINTKIQLESVRGKYTSGDLELNEVLNTT